ncbi:MAG: hypothetical protein WCL23_05070 [Candidatus Moraniibacteriota bacterium]
MNINELFDNPQLSDSDALPFLENLIGDVKLYGQHIQRPYGDDPRPKHLEIQLRRGHVTMEQVRKAARRKLPEAGRKDGGSLDSVVEQLLKEFNLPRMRILFSPPHLLDN